MAAGVFAATTFSVFNAVDPPGGGVSVGLDAQDRLRMEIESCGTRVDSVELRELRPGGEESEGSVVGAWSVVTQADEGVLVLPAAVGWQVDRDPGPLDPDRQYALSATYVVGGRTGDTVFRPRDLASDDVGAPVDEGCSSGV